MSDEKTEKAKPKTDPAPAPPRDAGTPCPACNRSEAAYLTIRESLAAYGYGKTTCPECLLTDIAR